MDVRESDAFIGWPGNGAKRGGHIPGAANVAVSWVQDDLDGVPELLAAKGILGDKQLLLYGADFSQAERMADLLVKKHGVDASRLHLYADGFLAWSARAELPVDRLPKYDRLVPATWLAEQLQIQPELLVFEVSWRKRDDYERRHIPGARYLDTDLLEVGPIWNIVPPARLAEALTSLGIAHDVPVVLYGHDTTASARAAVVMLYAGVNDVRLLNGGFAAWQRAGLPVETGWVRPIPVKKFGATIPVHPEYITGLDHARGLLADRNGELVSIRSWEEFVGNKSGYLTIQATGRIKGAVWGHSGAESGMADFRNPDNTMRDYRDIVRFWADWGIVPEKRLGFYCGTGWRASEAFFAAWLMGWNNITVYDGGWFEWSQDPANPIADGDPRIVPQTKPVTADSH